MKNLLKTTMGAAVVLLLVSSCKKEEKLQIDTEKEITSAEMQNKANPYDNEGVMHNKFLDYFAANAGDLKKVNKDKAQQIFQGFMTSNKMQYGDEESGALNEVIGMYAKLGAGSPKFINNIAAQYPDWRELLKSTGPYNPNQIVDPRDAASGLPTGKRMHSYIKDVKDEESTILNNSKLSDEQKAVSLKYYAIARHSAAYWSNVINVQKEKSPYYRLIMDAQAEPSRLCVTCDVIGSDAAGAVVGAIFGGPVGAGVGAGVASVASILEYVFW